MSRPRSFGRVFGVLPVVYLEHGGTWTRSRGPVQLVPCGSISSPGRYPVALALASVSAVMFYARAAFLALFLLVAMFAPSVFCVAIAAAWVVAALFFRGWLVAMRYAMALRIASAEGEVLFWSRYIAQELGTTIGLSRARLDWWLDRIPSRG